MNINAIMQKAQSLQKEMQKMEEEVSKMTFSAKQPLVEVQVSGAKKVVSIKYDFRRFRNLRRYDCISNK